MKKSVQTYQRHLTKITTSSLFCKKKESPRCCFVGNATINQFLNFVFSEMTSRTETAANAALEAAIDWTAAEVDRRELEGWYDEDDDGSDGGNDEENADDDYEDTTKTLDNNDIYHWMSLEEQIELYQTPRHDYPKVEQWKNVETQGTVGITIDQARNDLKRLLGYEIKALRDGYNMKKRRKIEELAPEIFEKIFGADSKISSLFSRKLGWSHDKFLGFLATFFIQCAYRASVKELFSPTSELSNAGLMERESYMQCWSDIKKTGLGNRCS